MERYKCKLYIRLYVIPADKCVYMYVCVCTAAYELRTWLLHYSPVVLHGFLHSDYYQHHLLFAEGIYLLLKDTVEEEDISKSGELLIDRKSVV